MRKASVFIFMITAIMACTSTPKSEQSVKNFSDINGKELILIEVQIDDKNTGFNRDILLADGFKDIFTITFDGKMLAGIGAPNRYSAPYTLENESGISVKLIRATLMAALREPENLKEHDYFVYLQNAYKWNIANNRLEIHSKTESGAKVLLIFADK